MPVLQANPEIPIAGVTGQGSTMNLDGKPEFLRAQQHPKVDFEWKIAPSPEDRLSKRVQKWRYDTCGGSAAYHKLENDYLDFLSKTGLEDPRMGMRKLVVKRSATRSGGRFRSHYQPEKRSAEEMGEIQELDVKSRRLSMDSQSESVSSSSAMSPDISRQDPVAGWGRPAMGPPPPTNMERRGLGSRRGSRDSRGSTGSATARVTAGLEAMTVQSPAWASPQGMVPPFEESTWGGPPGTTGTGLAQFGGRYEPPIPGAGYQGPDQGQQAPGRGQLTEVYGHLQYVEPGPPRGPPQVGIEHTRFQEGRWNAPHSGWQHLALADQAPAHRSYHPVQRAQSSSGHNVPVPSPNVQVGGSYPPRFPDMPMAQSPQLYPAEHQLGQRNMPSSVPPNMSPIFQSLPPPVMDDIDLSQLQAPTTVPPVGENYPFSVPSTTEYMHAGLIALPEHEDAPVESKSYRGQGGPTGRHEYSDREDEDSDGEDDQFSHQDTPGGQALLYPGDYDNGRFYHSPIPSGGDQTVHQDPYWGGNESEEEIGQD